jgi:subtilase family serine protease
MQKAKVSVFLLTTLLVVLGTTIWTVATFAKNDSVSDPLANTARIYLIVKTKIGPEMPNTPNAVSGITPTQFRKAYGVNLLKNNGKGITVAVVDACGNSAAQSDLNKYDSTFKLPATTIKVVKPQGPSCNDPPGWGVEVDLDLQMVHAIAPQAKIVLEAAKCATFANLLGAAKDAYTNQGATVVSMSFGGGEFAAETGASADGIFKTGNSKGVSFTASSGDSACGAQYPAASPFVTSVGGTSLNIQSNGTYVSETAWDGSGGGVSAFEARPAYQNGFNSNSGRGIPDVAMVADPNTGVAMFDASQGGFIVVGGTSVAAPMWAGVLATANQTRSSSMKNADLELYNVAGNAAKYAADYHDITSGSSGGVCNAGPGYDLVTGLGSPKANTLVPDLVAAP